MSKSFSEQIYANLPTIVGGILLVALLINFFVVGGIPVLVLIRDYIAYSLPFTWIVGVVFALIANYRKITQREPGWWSAGIFFLAFFAQTAMGFLLGMGDPLYRFSFNLFATATSGAVLSGVTIGVLVGYMRTYIVRSTQRAWMVLIGVLSLAYAVGLYQMVLPGLTSLIPTLHAQYVGQVEFGLWTAYHLGSISLTARILTLRQKLTVTGTGD
jgi:hypothetical protein